MGTIQMFNTNLPIPYLSVNDLKMKGNHGRIKGNAMAQWIKEQQFVNSM